MNAERLHDAAAAMVLAAVLRGNLEDARWIAASYAQQRDDLPTLTEDSARVPELGCAAERSAA